MIVRPARTPDSGQRPSVTVVVPSYNYAHYLPQSVESALAQTDVELEVVVIDDASTDGSLELARAFEARDDRVRVVAHERNHGHTSTYNEGLALADGDYVVLLSADDLLTDGALGRAAALMTAYPEVGLVYGNPRVFTAAVPPPPPSRARAQTWSIWKGQDWIRAQCRRTTSIIYSPEAVVRTSVQHEVGNYRLDQPHAGDVHMWLRIAAVSDVGRINGPDQALRRDHDQSMMHSTFAGPVIDFEGRLLAYDSFLDEVPGMDPRLRERCRRLAHRGLAREAIDWANWCDELGRSPDLAAACIEFAHRVHPGYRNLAAWHEHRVRQAGRPAGRPVAAGHRLRRDLSGRLKWQRWRHLGI